MIYNNLVYLLVVILILSTRGTPTEPQIEPLAALLVFLVKGLLYQQIAHQSFRRRRVQKASHYFAAEQKLSILAIFFLGLDVYFLDSQYYFAKLPLAETLPVISQFAGLLLYTGYLAILWTEARPSYQLLFGRRHSLSSFLAANIKINTAIVLPWLLLSLLSDLLQHSSLPVVKDLLASTWGEPVVLLLFFLLLLITFPAIVTRLWDCRPLPAGPTRNRIEMFCRQHRLRYAEILTWPLFEGRMLTAGIMGIVRRFRYLLITPALLETMTPEEIEAVVAHEIGHVKRYHLQLYLLLFLGFGLLAQLSSYPLLSLVLNSDLFYKIVQLTGNSPVAALTTASTVSLLVVMILYFRFLFGFFMRNFERQADLYALQTIGDAAPLIRVFEKIAWLSGKIRDLPSWHHFGIGQRIDFLARSQEDPSLIKRHNRKVYGALLLYLAAMGLSVLLLWKLPPDLLEGAPKAKFAEALLQQKIREEPDNFLWRQFLADLYFTRKQYPQAMAAYEAVLSQAPDNPDTLNNLAWLLMTAEDRDIRDPGRALKLAQKAALLKPAGYILDTLATAYWMNGFSEKAIRAEQEAIQKDPAEADYYRGQLEKFSRSKP